MGPFLCWRPVSQLPLSSTQLTQLTRFNVTCHSISRRPRAMGHRMDYRYSTESAVQSGTVLVPLFSRIGETIPCRLRTVRTVQCRTIPILARSWFILGYERRTPRQPRTLHINCLMEALPPRTCISTDDAAYTVQLSATFPRPKARKNISTRVIACAQRVPSARPAYAQGK